VTERFHDTDAFSEVGGLGGGLLARRAGADYDEVEAFIHRFPQAADVVRPEDNQPYTPLGDSPLERVMSHSTGARQARWGR
jgi:hypothetical protein